MLKVNKNDKVSSKTVVKNNKEKFKYNEFSSREIEEELKRIKYKDKYVVILKSTVYFLIIIVAFAVLIATLILPVLQVSGTSMAPTYNSGDILVSFKTSKLNYGDVIAFYHGNKILIKRVIASAGSWVTIDDDGNVYVDGEKLNEEYVENKKMGNSDIKYPYQVKDGQWFVLSDNRDDLIDSRNSEVGCVSSNDLIGKVLFKIYPIN